MNLLTFGCFFFVKIKCIFYVLFIDPLGKGDLIKNSIVKEDGLRDTILSKGIDYSRRNSYSDLSKWQKKCCFEF